jgi:sugar lactone lactonase YvrE
MTGASGSGLEALTFVTDAGHPEGGTFYAGLQDGGVIYRFSLPILSSPTSTAVNYLGSFTPVAGRNDLSGLDYVAGTGVLYAIYDGPNYLRAMTPAGSLLREWDLPGSNQEGVALRGNDLFIAQDSGDIVRYTPFAAVPEPGPLAAAAAALGAGLAWRRARGRQRTVARK